MLGQANQAAFEALNALVGRSWLVDSLVALALDNVLVKAGPIGACPHFPRDIVEMIAVGEESNSLEKVLLDIANALEKRTARYLELFVRLLEPVMLLVMVRIGEKRWRAAGIDINDDNPITYGETR